MTNDELMALDGKIACGHGGKPVVITKLTVGESFKKDTDGNFLLEIRLSGSATGTLVNPNDPNDGADDFPGGSTLECGEGVGLEEKDKQKFYDKLNSAFNIQPPLVDTEDEWLRFAPEAENSVYSQIVDRETYFRIATKAPTNPKFSPQVYTNLHRMKQRELVSLDRFKEIKEKMAAKALAAEKKRLEQEKELADTFA